MKTIRVNKYRVLNADHVVSIHIERDLAQGCAYLVFKLVGGQEARRTFKDIEKAREALDKLVEYLES